MKSIKLKIYGMHCPSCTMLIQDVVEDLDGVIKADVSLESSRLRVFFDDTLIDERTIRDAVESEGYKTEKT
ncbi:MAG: heavy-metal-associated domain-containing protein [DPANN group archaeon]|nr:heavy-metal-associated domain-containing protein [DPANN group archaeon]